MISVRPPENLLLYPFLAPGSQILQFRIPSYQRRKTLAVYEVVENSLLLFHHPINKQKHA